MKLRCLVKYPYSLKVNTLNALNIIGVFCVLSAGYETLLQPNISAHLFMAFAFWHIKKTQYIKLCLFVPAACRFSGPSPAKYLNR